MSREIPVLCQHSKHVNSTAIAHWYQLLSLVDLMANMRWKNDIAYAITPFKFLTWPIGIWPLQVYDVYSLVRCVLTTCCMVCAFLVWSRKLLFGRTIVSGSDRTSVWGRFEWDFNIATAMPSIKPGSKITLLTATAIHLSFQEWHSRVIDRESI